MRKVGILQIGVLPLWSDGGDSIHTRELATAFLEEGIDPILLTLPGPQGPSGTNLREIRVPVLRTRFLLQASWNVLGSLKAVQAIRKHNLALIYSRLDPGMYVGLIAARLTGRPLVVEMNGLPTEDVRLYRPHNALLLSVTRNWERAMYCASSRIVGAPGYVRYVQDHFDVPEAQCCQAPLGVNTEIFRPLDRSNCLEMTGQENRPTIVWTGQLSPRQGLETLLSAARVIRGVIPDVRLLVVGDGTTRPFLEERVREMGIDDIVRFLGRVPYTEVQYYLGCANVCVATFPGERGDPGTISYLKIMTYLACGRPVVTSDMDEMAAVICDTEAGDSVPPDDSERLAAVLVSVLKEDDVAWRRRCEAARRLAEQRTWQHKAARVATCLRELSSR